MEKCIFFRELIAVGSLKHLDGENILTCNRKAALEKGRTFLVC